LYLVSYNALKTKARPLLPAPIPGAGLGPL
jgi:hypothetical protein